MNKTLLTRLTSLETALEKPEPAEIRFVPLDEAAAAPVLQEIAELRASGVTVIVFREKDCRKPRSDAEE